MTDAVERRYLDQLDAALSGTSMSQKERREVLFEIENHLAEAKIGGVSTADLVRELGPADELARGYAAELLLKPIRVKQRPLRLLLRGVTVIASAVTTLVIGSLACIFLVGGTVGIVLGAIGPFLPAQWLDPTLRAGAPQAVVIIASVLLAAVGAVLFRILLFKLRLPTASLHRPMLRAKSGTSE